MKLESTRRTLRARLDRATTWITSDQALVYFKTRFSGGRVLKDELGPWPEVYRERRGYVLMAPHTPPSLNKAHHGLAILVGSIGFLYGITHLPGPGPKLWQESLLAGLMYAGVTWLGWRVIVRGFLKTTVRFKNGKMSWSGCGRRGKVPAGNVYVMEVKRPHRKATEEERRDKRSRFPRRPLYGVASELLLQTGARMAYWRTIAAFDRDEDGERAHRLKSAIELVQRVHNREVVARNERVAVSDGPADDRGYS